AKGNEGVGGAVKQTPGAIGYVEVAYALQNGLAMAALKNQAGQFVAPSVESTAAAAEGVAARVAGGDFKVSLVNAPGAQAYPISSWTYLLVPQHWDDCGKANAFAGLVRWGLTQGSDMARELHYAPLPDAVRPGVLAQLDKVTCGASNETVKPAA
ncbi:MAG TPA: substrate-binding domain-containing protein, partial [Longimicrobiaceae bacterium]|nr:substrate-binding domain-containing protein [Longimicrobiaceae bacterium]